MDGGREILKKRSVLRLLAFPLGGVGAGEGPAVGEARAFCVEYSTPGELGGVTAVRKFVYGWPLQESSRGKSTGKRML